MTSGDELSPVRLPKAAELVASSLRRRIMSGEIAAGEALASETTLLEQFAVSRPTLREAFRVLESEGLITVRRGARGGARAHPPRVEVAAHQVGFLLQHRGARLSDVYDCRTELEAQLARLTARKADDVTVQRLEGELSNGSTCLDEPETYFRHEIAFHLCVAELSGNTTGAVFVDLLNGVLTAAHAAHVSVHGLSPEQTRSAHAAHKRLLSFVRARDPEGAERSWRRHLQDMSDDLQSLPGVTTVVELLS